jgi:hypothetical protein
MGDPTPLLTKKEAARFLKVSIRTLDRLHEIPRVRLSRNRVAFRAVDLEQWAVSRLEKPVWRDEDALVFNAPASAAAGGDAERATLPAGSRKTP